MANHMVQLSQLRSWEMIRDEVLARGKHDLDIF